jgi:hypothetical protein
MPRRKLFRPSAHWIPLRLTERDRLILQAVGACKYLTGSLCAAFLIDYVQPPKVRGTRTGQVIKRLMADLYQHGYLTRPRAQVPLWSQQEGSHELIYSLTGKGRAALEATTPGSTKGFILPSKQHLPLMFHSLMIARFRITLLKALTSPTSHASLTHWHQGKDLKAIVQVNGKRTPIVPDAFLTLQLTDRPGGQNTSHNFLEADRSTMSLKRFQHKLLAYQTYRATGQHTAQYGITTFRVLTITPSPQRRDHLRDLAQRTLTPDQARFCWFATAQDYDPNQPETILAPIWRSGKDQTPRRLIPPLASAKP